MSRVNAVWMRHVTLTMRCDTCECGEIELYHIMMRHVTKQMMHVTVNAVWMRHVTLSMRCDTCECGAIESRHIHIMMSRVTLR